MSKLNGLKFSANDLDVDTGSGFCSQKLHGGWWYSDCGDANLNGVYGDTIVKGSMYWNANTTDLESYVVMMIRPASYSASKSP